MTLNSDRLQFSVASFYLNSLDVTVKNLKLKCYVFCCCFLPLNVVVANGYGRKFHFTLVRYFHVDRSGYFLKIINSCCDLENHVSQQDQQCNSPTNSVNKSYETKKKDLMFYCIRRIGNRAREIERNSNCFEPFIFSIVPSFSNHNPSKLYGSKYLFLKC